MIWKNNKVLILAFLVLAGCLPQKETIQTRILPAGDLSTEAGGFLYALPMTSLSVTVDVTKVSYRRGPYADYAKTLLDMDRVITRDRDVWVMDNISVASFQTADPGEYYRVITGESLLPAAFTLTRQGLLLLLNPAAYNNAPDAFMPQEYPEQENLFPVKNLKGMTVEYRDTAYRPMATDTGFIEIPVIVTRSKTMTPDEKAKDAAKTLINIRTRKFRLVSRNNSKVSMPAGSGMKVAVDELNRLEKQYLELFAGKEYQTSYRYSLLFTPADTLHNPSVLFRFLPALGVLPADDLRGDPVEIAWDPVFPEAGIQLVSNDSIPAVAAKVTYRMPRVTRISLTYKGKKIYSRDLLIYQLGSKTGLPANILFPETGTMEK